MDDGGKGGGRERERVWEDGGGRDAEGEKQIERGVRGGGIGGLIPEAVLGLMCRQGTNGILAGNCCKSSL